MTTDVQPQEVVAALRSALKDRDRLRRENKVLLAASTEPIAIVGMSCRYPGGVGSPRELWELVATGRDAISLFPEDRGWNVEALGVREGGFLHDAGDFDAEFFGISPREALATDPQQRLLLEAAWEALEDAGIEPGTLRGKPVGVVAGVMQGDYGIGSAVPEEMVGAVLAGVSASIASGRISYLLGLEGPTMSVDTACSSSLVAIHLACQSLRSGECTMALAGGVAVFASPAAFVGLSLQGGLSPDGRCKTFADTADGTGFSEGVGMVVLERLSDAERAGHRVLATVRGSAVNQDGASNGLTAPNGPAQERLIRQALANAGLSARDVDAVEAHGTGTTLGDPIEAGALLATYGQDRERPLRLGSLKSNVGHTQAAAGVGGVIKSVMAMREGVLPPTLHVDAPSSHVDWGSGSIELLRDAEPWETDGRPRRIGVSAFGISGTNAHLILEEGPGPTLDDGGHANGDRATAPAPPLPGPFPLMLSARTETALQESASRLAAHLRREPGLDPRDVAFSLASTRRPFAHRAAWVGEGREDLLGALDSLASGAVPDSIVSGRARASRDPVLLFAGQGPQHALMAGGLLDGCPLFASHMEMCEEALAPHVDWSLAEVLRDPEGTWLSRIDIVQPALFAVMVALARLWQACGLRPAAVVGHSQGEIAAAHIAGGLSLDDAALLVALRSRLISRLKGTGAMVSVGLGRTDLDPWLERWGSGVEVAGTNGPSSTTLSVGAEVLEEVISGCREAEIRVREIPATIPSHSARVDPLRGDLLEALAGIAPKTSEIPFHSTVAAGRIDTATLGPDYWFENLRRPVRLEEVVRGLAREGHDAFIEVGPHPVFSMALGETLADELGDPSKGAVLHTLRRGEDGPTRMARSIAEAQVAGVQLDPVALHRGARTVPLPTYPFQRRRYWLASGGGAGDLGAAGLADADHPLLGAALEDPDTGRLTLTGRLSLQSHPWLAEHSLAGTVLLPGAAFVELALHAAGRVDAEMVEELTLAAPLVLPEQGAVEIQVLVGPEGEDGDGSREISIHSRPRGDDQETGGWTRNATGRLGADASAMPAPDPSAWPPGGAEPLAVDDLYGRLADLGFDYGPAFQGLTAAWRSGEEILAEVSLAEEQAREAGRFSLHPALLDAALHTMALAPVSEEESAPALPFSWQGVSVRTAGSSTLRVRLSRVGERQAHLELFDADGVPVATVGSLDLRPVDPTALRGTTPSPTGLLGISWREVEVDVAQTAATRHEAAASRGESGTAGTQDEGGDPDAGTATWRCPSPEGDPTVAVRGLLAATLDRVKEHLAAGDSGRLAILTSGAVAASECESPDPAQAAVWGLVRSAQTEHPGRFVLVDDDGAMGDDDDGAASSSPLAAALGLSEEPQLAIREGRVMVARAGRIEAAQALVPPFDAVRGEASSLDPDRTVLVTGATGTLGSLTARHLVSRHGARHLLLVSRSGPDAPGAAELEAELREMGAEAGFAACDVGDRDALAGLLDSIPSEHPLGAIFHAAADLDDATVDNLDAERFDRVLSPKADAAWHLHELTRDAELSAFVVFASISGALGGPGQGNYAAANCFCDALASVRHASGLPATSIGWGYWGSESALTARLGAADLARMGRAGIAPLSDEQGLALLDAAIASGCADPLAVGIEPAGLRQMAEAGMLPPLLSELVRTPRRRRASTGSLARTLAALPESERADRVLEMVRSEVASVLGHDSPRDVDPERAFQELGFDSLAAVELRNRLAALTDLRLAPTIVFDHPTTERLAEHLLAEASASPAAVAAAPARALGSDEPIAIVGMSCRYPGGVTSPRELWELVAEGRDAIGGFPEDRGWDLERLYDPDPDHPGTSYVREGGFLYDAGDFDAEFFGISPREAIATDPQQRLLLEGAWEALEDAKIDPGSLRGEPAGVFAGVMYQDYGLAEHGISAGMTTSMITGRIAYALGLEGPTMTVDTACSSSLVAIHLACQSLRSGECSMAIAGGVTMLATPSIFIAFSRQRGLAPDARCKAFGEGADGTGMSEGVGVVVLERLSDAERAGHRILATVRGSAVNQDGASNGITAPNGPAQERLIRQALANAGLSAADVDAVEGHGTGTSLGDPIEAGALLATYGQDRDTPLRLGSLKSNVGHTQAAAGVGGVIKSVMAMREGVLPPTLHAEERSSRIDWDSGSVELLTESLAWETDGRPRRIGVSSFGASGTNAHLILEQGPEEVEVPAEDRGQVDPDRQVDQGPGGDVGRGVGETSAPVTDDGHVNGDRADALAPPLPGPFPLMLSARTEAALQESAGRLAGHLRREPGLGPRDVAFSLASTRRPFAHRAAWVGEGREDLLGALDSLASGAVPGSVVSGRARSSRDPVLLFAGQGPQHALMAVGLMDGCPLFASHIHSCEEALAPHVDWSLTEVLRDPEGTWLSRIDVVQPVLFAVMVALARLWQACGLRPAAVVGHSQGEIAAAHIAGGLSLEDAALVVARRSRAVASIAGRGTMASVSLPADELEELLTSYDGAVSLAARNGPTSQAVSGEPGAIGELLAHCEAEGIRARPIAVDYAAHSPQIDPLREELVEAFSSITPMEGEIPFHSTVTGERLDTTDLDARYWAENLRRPVLMEPVLTAMLEGGRDAFLEISPHPVLSLGLEEAAEASGSRPAVLSTLRRGEDGPGRMARSIAEAQVAGVELDPSAMHPGARTVPLPTYPFQRRRYWLASGGGAGDLGAAGLADADHPLLGAALEDPDTGRLTLTGRLSLQSHPWLAEHSLGGTVLLPGAAFVELALHAAGRVDAEVVEELTLAAPLILPEQGAVEIQVLVGPPDGDGSREISIHSRPRGDDHETGGWTRNATGRLGMEATTSTGPDASGRSAGAASPMPGADGSAWPPAGAEPLAADDLYGRLADLGLDYGPAFQGLTAAWRSGGEILAEVSLAEEQAREAGRFDLHPALLDAALQATALSDGMMGSAGEVRLPASWSKIALHRVGASELRVRLRLDGDLGTEVTLIDPSGSVVASIEKTTWQEVDRSRLKSVKPTGLLAISWREVEVAAAESAGRRDETVASGGAGTQDKTTIPDGAEPNAAEAASDGVDPGTGTATWRCASPEGDPTLAVRGLLAATLERVKEHLAAGDSGRLAILTRGAVAASEGESPDPAQAAVWGLVRSAQTEHPGRFVLVDGDGAMGDDDGDSAAALAAALSLAEEPQLAIREDRVLVARAGRIEVDPETAPPIDPDRTVLVTGATGTLGSLTARHLVSRHGARHLLLVSRSGPDAPGAAELEAELREMGAEAGFAACDVGDRDALATLLDSIPAEHPLGAVVHAAGAIDDATVENLDDGQFDTALGPKSDAAWHLHELTAGMELSAFVVFSSASGALGGPGQGNYAAANCFCDALASARRAEGLPATSIGWGYWESESALTSGLGAAELARMRRSGVAPLTDEMGLALMDAAIASGRPAPLAVGIEPAGLRQMAEAGMLPPLLSGLVRVPRRRRASTGSLARTLASLPESEREDRVLELVRSEVASVLGHDSPRDVDPERAFQELGFDSLAAVELRNRLAALTDLRLAPTIVFDHPTTERLAEHLLAEASTSPAAVAAAPARALGSDEPIAIVGMSCRYPGGVGSPRELWELVAEGRDAIGGFPEDRGWGLEHLYDPDPDHPGTSYVREGGFLYDAGDFDAEFFGISSTEAIATDPQQRLLLEAAWEALEDAGIDPGSLRGEPAGVFAGVIVQDYAVGHGAGLEGQLASGNLPSVASGRIAYTLGLEGPAISIDTACSSSLVAIHLACQSLRSGESTMALAGGAMVLSTPMVFTELSRLRGLSNDGRCRSFADAADGTGFSEGVGMVVLERLSDAQRAGHRILATVRGSAVNQDGASNGLTAPNGPAQERLIRQALANAGLSARDVDAVEAHGTGTTLGDPIEAGALLATYGQDRERPLRLGSLKSNVGHTQAAAGVGGVIKSVMAMREGVLPPTLHVDAPSSHVDWGSGNIELLRDAEPWETDGGRPRRIGVSAFGISGTNAHLILEQGPGEVEVPAEDRGRVDPDRPAPPLPGPFPLMLSARTEAALQESAGRLAAHLRREPGLDPRDVAFSLASTRRPFAHRAAWVGEGREDLLGALDSLAQGGSPGSVVTGRARSFRDPVLLFAGQGPQHALMAAGLMDGCPLFASHIHSCEEALAPHVEWSLAEVLRDPDGAWLDRIDVVQPALFAVMVALARLWQACGLRPAAVVGHSQGEIAAAHIAGGLSLDDAALVVARRSRAVASIAGKGAMASVSLPADELEELLTSYDGAVSLAARNGPASQAVSGEPDAVGELLARCEEKGIRARPIAVDYAAHSPQIDPLREELLEAFSITPLQGYIPFHSTVTGARIETTDLGARYWFENLRRPVLMEPVLTSMLEQGRDAFLEISPHPVLSLGLEEAAEASGSRPAVLSSLRRGEDGPDRMARSLAEARVAGVEVDPAALHPGARTVPLPTYPFQRRRYWLASGGAGGLGAAPQATSGAPGAIAPLLALDGSQLDGFAAQLAAAPPDERHHLALDFVTEQARAALALTDDAELDPDADLVELGFESVRLLELRHRLAAPVGKLMPLSVFADGTSIAGLSRLLLELIDAADAPTPDQRLEPESTGFLGMLRQAVRDGEAGVFTEMLYLGSSLQPRAANGSLAPLRVVRLATGPQQPALVLIPSVLAGSGPHEYAQLARHFAGERDVLAVSLPGFSVATPLPADLAAAANALAAALAPQLQGRDFVLAGHSSGGWLAHRTAAELEAREATPRRLLLIDAFVPAADSIDLLLPVLLAGLAEGHLGEVLTGDHGLLAMAAYMSMFRDWEPEPAAVPSVLLAAEGTPAEIDLSPWTLAGERLPIPGDHFSVMREQAPQTAAAVRRLLTSDTRIPTAD